MWPAYVINLTILFSNKYRYVRKYFALYVTSYYIFVYSVTSYYLICALLFQSQYLLKYAYNYGLFWLNQHRSHGEIFKLIFSTAKSLQLCYTNHPVAVISVVCIICSVCIICAIVELPGKTAQNHMKVPASRFLGMLIAMVVIRSLFDQQFVR